MLPSLQHSYKNFIRLVYWGRVDLSASQEDLATYFSENTIPMFRNQAWFSYDAQSLPEGMTITGSAVCNVYGNGTSIPFNSIQKPIDLIGRKSGLMILISLLPLTASKRKI